MSRASRSRHAPTERGGRRHGRSPPRTITDAIVTDTIRDIVWTLDHDGRRRMRPEGLYGRRKMTAYVRRHHRPDASWGAVDRAMRMLGLSGGRAGTKHCGPRSRPRTAVVLGTCSIGTSARRRRTTPGSPTSPTSGAGPGGSTSRSSSTASPRRSSGGMRPPARTCAWSTCHCAWRCGPVTGKDTRSGPV